MDGPSEIEINAFLEMLWSDPSVNMDPSKRIVPKTDLAIIGDAIVVGVILYKQDV